jgi:hypothetical protein
MVNSMNKMYDTNSKIKNFLEKKGVTNLYMFPHSRFSKDYIIDEVGFDAIGTLGTSIIFFQFKTNEVCPKKILLQYKELMSTYSCIMCWVTKFDKKKLTKKHSNEIEVFCPINIL